MTHLTYVVAAYVLGMLVPGTFAVAASIRLRTARRQLAAIDRRRRAR
jgi:hypothetical protein